MNIDKITKITISENAEVTFSSDFFSKKVEISSATGKISRVFGVFTDTWETSSGGDTGNRVLVISSPFYRKTETSSGGNTGNRALIISAPFYRKTEASSGGDTGNKVLVTSTPFYKKTEIPSGPNKSDSTEIHWDVVLATALSSLAILLAAMASRGKLLTKLGSVSRINPLS